VLAGVYKVIWGVQGHLCKLGYLMVSHPCRTLLLALLMLAVVVVGWGVATLTEAPEKAPDALRSLLTGLSRSGVLLSFVPNCSSR
jgi:hypothetical protein